MYKKTAHNTIEAFLFFVHYWKQQDTEYQWEKERI